jgi:hypothetical protein
MFNAKKVTCVLVATGLMSIAVGGCAGTSRLAVPEALASEATVAADLQDIRYWGDVPPKNFEALTTEIC